mmetsp:Transcript_73332/g.203468  ORF Transcript_73332/g.203468 Transcript_73332/m.203468 type:complete len:202 (+) Transcript_73332:521-1126(+)
MRLSCIPARPAPSTSLQRASTCTKCRSAVPPHVARCPSPPRVRQLPYRRRWRSSLPSLAPARARTHPSLSASPNYRQSFCPRPPFQTPRPRRCEGTSQPRSRNGSPRRAKGWRPWTGHLSCARGRASRAANNRQPRRFSQDRHGKRHEACTCHGAPREDSASSASGKRGGLSKCQTPTRGGSCRSPRRGVAVAPRSRSLRT